MVRWRRAVATAAGAVLVSTGLAVLPASPGSAGITGVGFYALAPTRLVDTRTGLGAPKAALTSGRAIAVRVTGPTGVPDDQIGAVVLNVTAVGASAGGYLTVYPAGSARPVASTVNFASHQTVANAVVARVGTDGKVAIADTGGATNVVVDVSGYFAKGSYYTSLTPTRLLDTRSGVGAPARAVGPGGTVTFRVAGRGGVPASGVVAVALNVTGTAPTAQTYETAYAAGSTRPTTSNLNLARGQTAATLTIVRVGAGGAVTLWNASGSTHLVADVSGWFAAGGQYIPDTPTRDYDTRHPTDFHQKVDGHLLPGETRVVNVSPAPIGVFTVTVTNPSANGNVTVYDGEAPTPQTSNLNFSRGQTVANTVITSTGIPPGHADEAVLVHNNSPGTIDLVVDEVGSFVPVLQYWRRPDVPAQATVGAPYEGTLSPVNGVAPYTFTMPSGSLPDGLTLHATGPLGAAITGVPTTAGTSTFTVRAADSSGMADDETFTVTVRPFVPGAEWAWGRDQWGQLGNGGEPVPNFGVVRVHSLSDVASIAAGLDQAYALEPDGTVWAWGTNLFGELGNGTTSTSPTSTPAPVDGLSGVTAVFAGVDAGYALESDGSLWAWGGNPHGGLGDGTTVDRHLPVPVTGLSGVTSVAGGSGFAFALTSDGSVWAWGANTHGELGDGTTVERDVPARVEGLDGVVAVAAGRNAGYAVKSDGTVWSWGSGQDGQLGTGSVVDSPTPVQVPGLTGVTAVAGRFGTGYALEADGTVRSWGLDTSGQVGDGTTAKRLLPVPVAGLTGVTEIGDSRLQGYALKADGSVWAWGDSSLLFQHRPPTAPAPFRLTQVPPAVHLSAGQDAAYVLGTTSPPA